MEKVYDFQAASVLCRMLSAPMSMKYSLSQFTKVKFEIAATIATFAYPEFADVA
jgi:hypothetical protein